MDNEADNRTAGQDGAGGEATKCVKHLNASMFPCGLRRLWELISWCFQDLAWELWPHALAFRDSDEDAANSIHGIRSYYAAGREPGQDEQPEYPPDWWRQPRAPPFRLQRCNPTRSGTVWLTSSQETILISLLAIMSAKWHSSRSPPAVAMREWLGWMFYRWHLLQTQRLRLCKACIPASASDSVLFRCRVSLLMPA